MPRPIHLAKMDKVRPVLILTREVIRPYLTQVTVAPISGTVRGLRTEVPVGAAHGLDKPSVINCDNIATISTSALLRRVGYLYAEDEQALAAAIATAFALHRA